MALEIRHEDIFPKGYAGDMLAHAKAVRKRNWADERFKSDPAPVAVAVEARGPEVDYSGSPIFLGFHAASQNAVAASLFRMACVRAPLTSYVLARIAVREVSSETGVSIADIKGPSRKQHIADARHLAVRRVKAATGWTQENLGDYFGRDHSSICNSLNPSRRKELRKLRAAQ